MAPLIHPVSKQVRPAPIQFSKEYLTRSLAEDREIINRLIDAYQHALASAHVDVRRAMCGTIWSETGVVGKQTALIQALASRSAPAVHDILRKFFITDAAFGIAMGKREADVVRFQPEHNRHYGLMWLDRLVGLAHATDAIPIPNPEDSQDRWQRSLEVDAGQVLAAIEKRVGMAITFPELCAVFGGAIGNRPFPAISFTHLLVALTMRSLVPDAKTVFEIGGGFGGLAYFFCQAQNCRYTIFDLPWANAVQAYFLNRALPGRTLVLSGEKPDPKAAISLAPAWKFHEQPGSTRVDLIVNQDSMPEMPREAVLGYLRTMRAILNGPFLSINQEPDPDAPTLWNRDSVAQYMEKAGGFTRLSRSPFFLRMGYVQEVYYPRPGFKSQNQSPSSFIKPVKTALKLMSQGDFQAIKHRLGHRLNNLFARH